MRSEIIESFHGTKTENQQIQSISGILPNRKFVKVTIQQMNQLGQFKDKYETEGNAIRVILMREMSSLLLRA